MRLLVVTIIIAAGVLLVLARFRFPEQLPASVDTSTQPLERLAARASFEELANRVARFEQSIGTNLLVLRLNPREDSLPIRLDDVNSSSDATRNDVRHVPALRIDETTAVASIPPDTEVRGIVEQSAVTETATSISIDRVRHIASVRVPEGRPTTLRQLALGSLQTPTYVIAVEGTRAGVTIRPVFLGRSDRFNSPRWTRPLLPLGGAVVIPGALMFTLEGEFLGAVVTDEGTPAIASANDVLQSVGRAGLNTGAVTEPGIAVQALTVEIAAATGASSGVVVAEVDTDGSAAAVLEPGDVIIATEGQSVGDPKSFLLDLGARLAAGPVRITFVRDEQPRQAELQSPVRAVTAAAGTADPWRLELVRGVGTKVVAVKDGSPFAVAGLVPDDVILRIADVYRPTPAQIASVLRDAPSGRLLLLVVGRSGSQHVTAVRTEGAADGVTR